MPTEIIKEPLPDDYRQAFDRDYIAHFDLPEGKDVVVEISDVKVGKLQGQGDKKERKILLWFKGKDKGFVVNKTNATLIAGMHGKKPAGWIGCRIALYATTCSAFGKQAECVRVRPRVPVAAVKSEAG